MALILFCCVVGIVVVVMCMHQLLIDVTARVVLRLPFVFQTDIFIKKDGKPFIGNVTLIFWPVG